VGLIAVRRKDFELAEESYLTVLEMLEALTPGPHDETARALANLGSLRYWQGRYGETVELAERALDMYEALGIPQNPRAVDTAHLRSLALAKLEGR
jgi:hypothetical protein